MTKLVTLTRAEALQAVKDLRAAHRLLKKPSVWIKQSMGYDKYGDSVEDMSLASQVCSLGAIGKVRKMNSHSNYEHLPAVRFLACAIDPERSAKVGTIINFNDARSTRHTEVLDKFRKGIKLAEIAAGIEPRKRKKKKSR